jgi:hypothetical protein
VLADNFQSLYHQASAIASQIGVTSIGSLEGYWTDIDAYPDLESEKRQDGFTNDADLRAVAKEISARLDLLWLDIVQMAARAPPSKG